MSACAGGAGWGRRSGSSAADASASTAASVSGEAASTKAIADVSQWFGRHSPPARDGPLLLLAA